MADSGRPMLDYLLLIDALRDLAYIAIVEDPNEENAAAWALGMADAEVTYGSILAESKAAVEAYMVELRASDDVDTLPGEDEEFDAWMSALRARQAHWLRYRAEERARVGVRRG